MRHSGTVLVAARIAVEYGFTDIDGKAPLPLTLARPRDDLFGIQQDHQVLGQESQSVHLQVFRCQPDGATLRHTELRADYSHIDVRKFVGLHFRERERRDETLVNNRRVRELHVPLWLPAASDLFCAVLWTA
jgi:hypothetical protein